MALIRNPRVPENKLQNMPRSMNAYKKNGNRVSYPKYKHQQHTPKKHFIDYDYYNDGDGDGDIECDSHCDYHGDNHGDYDYYNYHDIIYNDMHFSTHKHAGASASASASTYPYPDMNIHIDDKVYYLKIDDLCNENIIIQDIKNETNEIDLIDINHINIYQYKKQVEIIEKWWHNCNWFPKYIFARINIVRDYMIYNPDNMAQELKDAINAYDNSYKSVLLHGSSSTYKNIRNHLFNMIKLHFPFTDTDTYTDTYTTIILKPSRFIYKKQIIPTFNEIEFPCLLSKHNH